MRGIHVSERDKYLLLMGLFFAFLFQVFYDMIHEFIYNSLELQWYYWFLIQAVIAGIIVVILVILIANLREKNGICLSKTKTESEQGTGKIKVTSYSNNNKIKWWQTKYTWFTIASVIIAFVFSFIMSIASSFGWVLVLKEQVLIALLGVEATIVGFFGLIFVNGLASFRSIFETLARGFDKHREPKEASDYARAWWEAHSATTKNRIAYINHSLVTGAFLISSMFSVILALAVTFEDWTFYFSYLSIGILLIVCIPQILWAIHDLGKDTYQNWSQPILKT